MFSSVIKKNFSSKLYSNIANLQRLKTFRLPLNNLNEANEKSNENQKLDSNTENYLKALKTLNEKNNQEQSNKNKLKEIQSQINQNFLKKNNKIKYDNLEPSFDHDSPSKKKFQEKDPLGLKNSITLKLSEYKKIKENLSEIKNTISNCEEIMDLSQKLNNERYAIKINSQNIESSKEISALDKFNEEKIKNERKQTVIKNSHIYELYYSKLPFCNTLLTPHKYTSPFINYHKENTNLNIEFEHEQEILNNEIHRNLEKSIDSEMKNFSLNKISSDKSIFNDEIKNPGRIGYILQESSRDIDFDAGLQLEKLYFVVNQDDDFGVTMYKEEAEKKRPTEQLTIANNLEDKIIMTNEKSFPFTVDKKAILLAKSQANL